MDLFNLCSKNPNCDVPVLLNNKLNDYSIKYSPARSLIPDDKSLGECRKEIYNGYDEKDQSDEKDNLNLVTTIIHDPKIVKTDIEELKILTKFLKNNKEGIFIAEEKMMVNIRRYILEITKSQNFIATSIPGDTDI